MKSFFRRKNLPNKDIYSRMRISYPELSTQHMPILRWTIILLIAAGPIIYVIWKIFSSLFFVDGAGYLELPKLEVRAPNQGTIQAIFVHTGDEVAKLQKLLKIDNVSLNNQQEYLSNQVKLLKAKGLSPDIQTVASLEQQKNFLTQQVAQLEKQYLNALALVKKGAATNGEVEVVRQQYTQTQVQLDSVNGRLAAQRVTFSQDQYTLDNKTKKALSDLKRVEQQQQLLLITAPMPGKIVHLITRTGEFVVQGQSLLTLQNLHPVFIRVYLDPYYAKYAVVDAEVAIYFKGGGKMYGKVIRVLPITRSLPTAHQAAFLATQEPKMVLDILPNKPITGYHLIDGMPVTVRF